MQPAIHFEEIAQSLKENSLRLSRIEHYLLDIKKENISQAPDQTNQSDHLFANQVVSFFGNHGIPFSKSKLYKLTATKQIPFETFGRKLIFSRKGLLAWVESQTKEKV